jgi:FMN phosphatase YigB (HAD superfamily)
LFIDDRALNLECARQLGMGTVHFQNAAQLRQDLAASGVTVAGK